MSRSSFRALVLAALCAGLTQQAAAAYRCDSFTAINGYDSPTALTTAEGSVWYSTPDRLIRVQDRKSQGLVAVDAATRRLSGIAVGPDGALWYAKDTSARVGRLPLDGSAGTEFEVPDGKFVRGLHAAADGLWFYDSVKMFVGRIGTDGAIRRYDGPSMNGAPFSPSGLTVGPTARCGSASSGTTRSIGSTPRVPSSSASISARRTRSRSNCWPCRTAGSGSRCRRSGSSGW